MQELTDAEWEVMEALWSADSMTQAEIKAHLEARGIHWAGNTIHTFLTRLERKEAVAIRRNGVPYHYRALRDRASYEKQVLFNLKRKIFGNSAIRLLTTLLREEAVSEEELREIKEIIERNT